VPPFTPCNLQCPVTFALALHLRTQYYTSDSSCSLVSVTEPRPKEHFQKASMLILYIPQNIYPTELACLSKDPLPLWAYTTAGFKRR
jgi:hypothetical protein